MRCYLLLAIAVLMATVTVTASYKVVLDTGEIVNVEEKPVIRGDRAYFSVGELPLYLDIRRIDFQKSEEANREIEPEKVNFEEEVITHKPKAAKRRMNDEDIEEMRDRVRLSNEGELTPAFEDWLYGDEYLEEGEEAPEREPAAPARPNPQEDGRAALQRRLNDLVGQQQSAQQEQDRLQAEYRSLREQLDMSTQNEVREDLSSRIDSVRSDMNSAQTRLTNLNSQIRVTQQEIASQPVIVPVTSETQ